MNVFRSVGTAIAAALTGVGFAWAYCSLKDSAFTWPAGISTLPDAADHHVNGMAHSIAVRSATLPEPPVHAELAVLATIVEDIEQRRSGSHWERS